MDINVFDETDVSATITPTFQRLSRIEGQLMPDPIDSIETSRNTITAEQLLPFNLNNKINEEMKKEIEIKILMIY
jgi:hypothetical protein